MGITLNSEKLRWKTEYNIGNPTIDKEHQDLFSLAKKALVLVNAEESNSKEALIKMIVTLFKYVTNHFKNEQTYMGKINYPDLEQHKKLHNDMLDLLRKLITSLNTLDKKEIEQQLYTFIDKYFIQHIIMEDKRIHLWIVPIEHLRKSFGWKESYKVGNEKIDAEHKILFDIAQEAFQVVDSASRGNKIKSILSRLLSYVKTHFTHEEQFMTILNYPKLEEHKELHKRIIADLNGFVKQLPSMNITLFEKELARLIDILLLQHIIHEDRQIMKWYEKGNAS